MRRLVTGLAVATTVALADPAGAESHMPNGWHVPDVTPTVAQRPKVPACCSVSFECCQNEVSVNRAKPRTELRRRIDFDTSALATLALNAIDDEAAPQEDDWEAYTELSVIDSAGRPFGVWGSEGPSDRFVGIAPRGRASIIHMGERTADFFDHPLRRHHHAGLMYTWRARSRWTGERYLEDDELAGAPSMHSVQPMSWVAVTPDDEHIAVRSFRGHFDRDRVKVAPLERWTGIAKPIIDGLVYGFVTHRGGERTLHLIMPAGDRNVRHESVTVDDRGIIDSAAFSHVQMPLAPGAAMASFFFDASSLQRWSELTETKTSVEPSHVTVSVVRTAGDERPRASISFQTRPRTFFF